MSELHWRRHRSTICHVFPVVLNYEVQFFDFTEQIKVLVWVLSLTLGMFGNYWHSFSRKEGVDFS